MIIINNSNARESLYFIHCYCYYIIIIIIYRYLKNDDDARSQPKTKFAADIPARSNAFPFFSFLYCSLFISFIRDSSLPPPPPIHTHTHNNYGRQRRSLCWFSAHVRIKIEFNRSRSKRAVDTVV